MVVIYQPASIWWYSSPNSLTDVISVHPDVGFLITLFLKYKHIINQKKSCHFLNPHPRTCLLILEGKRRRNIHVRGRDQLVASRMNPDWGPSLQPKLVPWPRLEPLTFWFMRQCSNQLSHTGQGWCHFLNIHKKHFSFCLGLYQVHIRAHTSGCVVLWVLTNAQWHVSSITAPHRIVSPPEKPVCRLFTPLPSNPGHSLLFSLSIFCPFQAAIWLESDSM